MINQVAATILAAHKLQWVNVAEQKLCHRERQDVAAKTSYGTQQ
jgi:hypothetical protein